MSVEGKGRLIAVEISTGKKTNLQRKKRLALHWSVRKNKRVDVFTVIKSNKHTY